MNGYSRTGDTVTLTMSIKDYELVILAIGMATGTTTDPVQFGRLLGLANRLNEGNPNWTPYARASGEPL